MTRSLFLSLVVVLALSGCATFKAHDPFRNPDGTLNVRKIVMYVSYGIEADCALGQTALSQAICTYGREAVSAADAFQSSDPVYMRTSIAGIFEHAAHEHPQLTPYFDFGLKLLEAKL